MFGARDADLRTGWYVTACNNSLDSMQSAPLAIARRSKRTQPAPDIFDPHIPNLRVLSVLCQHFVALDHRDQKARSLFRNQVAADCSGILPLSQSGGNAFLPGLEDSLQSLPKLFVEQRHLLRQIGQGATALYIPWPRGYRLYDADQSINRVLVFALL